MSGSIVSVSSLWKSFKGNPVLKGIDFDLYPGEVYGLIGLNGTGKTTFLRTLLGILKPDKGRIEALGYNPEDADPGFYRRCGVVLENSGFYGDLSFIQNLRFYAAAKGIKDEELKRYIERYWSDTEIVAKGKKTRFFSRGQKMIAALARAFAGSPEFCILDEPAVALDMNGYDTLKRMVAERAEQGSCVIISSHQLDLIENICNRIGVLENGTISDYNPERNEWVIRSDIDKSDFKRVLWDTVGIENYTESGRYEFRVYADTPDPDKELSDLVKGIVSAGYRVFELRPAETTLQESMKGYYKRG